MSPSAPPTELKTTLARLEEEGRSGILTFVCGDERGELVFFRGRIVGALRSGWTRTVADILRAAGVLDEWDAVGDAALPLDSVLGAIARANPARSDVIKRADAVIETAIREVLDELDRFPPDALMFEEQTGPAAPVRHADDTRLLLPRGFKIEEQPESLSSTVVAARLIIVDDDASFRTRFVEEAEREGVSAAVLGDARAAIRAFASLREDPERRMLVDLVMPRANGRGILGGLEVLRRAHDAGVANQVVLLLEDEHPDAEAHAVSLGAFAVMRKPESQRGMRALVHRLVPQRKASAGSPVDLVGELRAELGASNQDWSPDPGLALDENAQSLETLRSLLAQVNDPTFEEEIPLLLLRFAAEFFSRGALLVFDRRSDMLIGQGGFGLSAADPGRTVHSLRISLDDDSAFSRCVASRTGMKTHLQPGNPQDRALLGVLGEPAPDLVYTAPLFSPRGLEAVLCADNAHDGRPFPDITLLQIFIQQAGVAMERSSLVREVQSLRPMPSSALS